MFILSCDYGQHHQHHVAAHSAAHCYDESTMRVRGGDYRNGAQTMPDALSGP